MRMIVSLIAGLMLGCVDSPASTESRDCGGLPEEPLWEYTTHAGAPAEAHIPLHMWLQDLEWRAAVRDWAACVSAVGER